MHENDSWRSGGSGKGSYLLQARSITDVPLIAQGTTGQTANLIEAKNVAGTTVFSVDNSGNVTYLGDEYVTDALTVTGNASITGTLGVTGASALGVLGAGAATLNSLLVTTTTRFIGDVVANHNLTVNNTIQANGFSFFNNLFLNEQVNAPTVPAEKGALYTKDASSVTELYYKDSAGSEIQLTSGGTIGGSGNLTLTGGGSIVTTSNGNITLLPNGSGITIVGDGSPSHDINTNDDLFITRRVEIDGSLYLDGGALAYASISYVNDVSMSMGSSEWSSLMYDTGQTQNTTQWGLDNVSRLLLICERADMAVDFKNAAQTHPTFIFQNADAKSIYGRGYIAHDNDDFTFQSHRGGFSFEVPAQYAQGTLTLTGIPSADETFVINATTITAKADGSGNVDHFTIGADATETVTNIVATIAECSEAANVKAWASGDTVVFEWKTAGTAGNSIVFTEALSNATIDGGGTLGGTHAGVAAGTPMALNEDLTTTLGGALVCKYDEITSASDGVAASITSVTTEITTNGDSDLDNVTLADGTKGQIKKFIVVAVGNVADSVKITPAHIVGGTQITFAANPIGLGCEMYFDGTNWGVVSNNGGTIA